MVIGSGLPNFREYVLRGLAARFRVVLVDQAPLDWQLRHVVEHRAVRDIHDRREVLASATGLAARYPLTGIVTWDEMLVTLAAAIGAELGVPTMPVAAARACRDKALQRKRFQHTGVPSAQFALPGSAPDALAAAAGIGYPVVVKPRAQAASIAVRVVYNDDELLAAFEFARRSEYPSVDDGLVLVEEFLRGQEICVDSWVLDGHVEPYAIAVKRTAYPPYFEDLAHIVGPVLDERTTRAVTDVVTRANNALGIDRTVTHTELILTADGPKVVEVNGRLGGDLIPHLAELATPGLSVGEIIGSVATGREPAPTPTPGRLVGIRFLYPATDLVLREVEVPASLAARPWVHEIRKVADPGTELRLPPREFLGRAGYGIVTGDSVDEVDDRLTRLAERIAVVGEPVAGYSVADRGQPRKAVVLGEYRTGRLVPGLRNRGFDEVVVYSATGLGDVDGVTAVRPLDLDWDAGAVVEVLERERPDVAIANPLPHGQEQFCVTYAEAASTVSTDRSASSAKWDGRFLAHSVEFAEVACDKVTLHETAAARGWPVPDGAVCAGPSEIARAVRRLGLPVVVKEAGAQADEGRFYVGSAADLDSLVASGLTFPVIAQRFERGDEFGIELVSSGSTTSRWPIVSMGPLDAMLNPGFRPRTAPAVLPVKAQESLTGVLRDIQENFAPFGAWQIDFAVVDGDLRILEINSRLSGLADIGVVGTGTDAHDVVAALAAGEPLPAVAPRQVTIDLPARKTTGPIPPTPAGASATRFLREPTNRYFRTGRMQLIATVPDLMAGKDWAARLADADLLLASPGTVHERLAAAFDEWAG